MRRLLLIGVILVMLAACGQPATPETANQGIGSGPSATTQSAVTAAPTSTPKPTTAPTPTPTPEPTATPTPTPTPEPTATPTPTPTPTPIPAQMGLREAAAQGLVIVTVIGRGLQRISVELTLSPNSTEPLEVAIPAGTVFDAHAASTQDMVVIGGTTILLQSPGDTERLQMSVACARMELDEPTDDDTFAVSQARTPEDLQKLLNLPDFLGEDFRVQQFAIWTITDNPPSPSAYVGLTYVSSPFGYGSGPTAEEFSRIRTLFERAGIDLSQYPALSLSGG